MQNQNLQSFVSISDSVGSAIERGKPVVALESTIISHGMPYPHNVETAYRVEQMVVDHGAVPATIAVMNGSLCVGLDRDQIELLGSAGPDAIKVSRRDIPFVIRDKAALGSTTVAATMIIASMAGIKVFATGGIGGVHRGADKTMDISADLAELATTSVAVVCAGAKSILDIGLTAEYLETHGVPVIGYQTDVWPAFYTRESDAPVDYRIDDITEIAASLRTKWSIGLSGGAVICNPVPEEYAMDPALINTVIDQAILQMNELGITGKETTPYLLSRIAEITVGDSLETNIQLVLNNAAVASEIAASL